MQIKDLGEIKLIKRFARQIRLDESVVVPSGDDTAVVKWTKDRYLLLKCDMVVEDVHFTLKGTDPFRIGWKAFARNISDIAAMGGIPRYALVSWAISPNSSIKIADGIFRGMKAAADRFKISIVGGDVSRSDKIFIDVSMVGEVEKDNLVRRSGAKPGDAILVTGAIGGSIKGRHLSFTPRLDEASMLVRGFKVNSMIDVSDGLVLDLWRILSASKAGARIYQSSIPVSKDASSFEKAITDGEDFELLFTMNTKEARRFFRTALLKMETPVSLIGEILPQGRGYKLIAKDGRERDLKAGGYLAF